VYIFNYVDGAYREAANQNERRRFGRATCSASDLTLERRLLRESGNVWRLFLHLNLRLLIPLALPCRCDDLKLLRSCVLARDERQPLTYYPCTARIHTKLSKCRIRQMPWRSSVRIEAWPESSIRISLLVAPTRICGIGRRPNLPSARRRTHYCRILNERPSMITYINLAGSMLSKSQ
jgi:hypothetical protein